MIPFGVLAQQQHQQGNLVEVPWTPEYITTALWLDAADASTFTLSGSNITEWRDKSGNDRHADTIYSTSPTYVTGQVNGNPVVRFAGGAFNMLGKMPASLAVNVRSVYTKPTSNGGPWQRVYSSDGGVDADYLDEGIYLIPEFGGDGATAGGPKLTAGSGETKVTNNFSRFAIGTLSSTLGTNSYYGDLCELVISTPKIATADIERIEGYLAHKWGVTGDLAAEHPYKTEAPTIWVKGTSPIELIGSTFVYPNTTSPSVTKPAGTQEGDLMIAQVNSRNSYVTAISDGWTPLWQHGIGVTGGFEARGGSYNEETHCFYKFAGASEPASYTFTTSSTGNAFGISTFRNVKSVSVALPSPNTNVAPSVTGTAGDWLLTLNGTSYEAVGIPNPPTGMINVGAIYDAGYDVGTTLTAIPLLADGATGTRTFQTNIWNSYAVAASIVLEGDPPDIPLDGLIVHLDASEKLSYPGVGTSWNDLSGSAKHANLVGSPTFNASLAEGVFEFPGSTGVYADISGSILDLTSIPHTILYVGRYGTGTQGRVLGSSSVTNWLGGFHTARNEVYYAGGWVYQVDGGDGTVWQHVTLTGDQAGDLWQMFRDGVALHTANNIGTSGPYGLRIGTDGAHGEPSDCDVGWMLVYNRVLSQAEITQVHEYIRTRYGL